MDGVGKSVQSMAGLFIFLGSHQAFKFYLPLVGTHCDVVSFFVVCRVGAAQRRKYRTSQMIQFRTLGRFHLICAARRRREDGTFVKRFSRRLSF